MATAGLDRIEGSEVSQYLSLNFVIFVTVSLAFPIIRITDCLSLPV